MPDRFPPWQAFHNEAPVFAAFALLAWSLRIWCIKPADTAPMLLMVGLICLVWLQWWTGLLPFAGDAHVATVYLAGLAVALQMGRQLGETTERDGLYALLALTFALGAAVSAGMAWVQFLELEDWFSPWVMTPSGRSRPGANLGQPNQLATLMLMGVVGLAYLWQQRRIGGFSSAVLAILVTTGIVLTQSRTAWLSATLLVLLWQFMVGAVNRGRVKAWIAWAWLAGLYGLIAFNHFAGSFASIVAAPRSDAVTVGLRPLLWQQLGAALHESPWVGYGWLQTAKAQQIGAIQVPGLEQTNYAHNLLLDLMIWCGIPAGLLIFGLVSLWLLKLWKGQKEPQGFLLIALLLPLAVHSMLELPFAYAYFLFPAGLLLGMLSANLHGLSASVPLTVASRRLYASGVGLLLIAFSVLVIALGWEYQQVEEDFRVVRFENMRVGQTPLEYEAPELHLLTQWGAVLYAMRMRAEPGMSLQDMERLKVATKRFSWAPLHFRYALALGLNEQAPQAAEQMALIKNLFGPTMYREARENFLETAKKYPALEKVKLP